MKMKKWIKTIKSAEKYLLKEDTKEEIRKNWESMGYFNPWYVIEENDNIIKLTWHDAWPTKKLCIIVKWDVKYTNCNLFFEGYSIKLDENISKIINLSKATILELENYLKENKFYNYFVSEKEKREYITLDGGSCTLEIKINNKYNIESIVAGAKNNKIISNFGHILFELSNEEYGNIFEL
jgi:aspartate 1-decarboxylase